MKAALRVFQKEWLEEFRNLKSLLTTVLAYLLIIPMVSILPYGLLLNTAVSQLGEALEVGVQNLEYAPSLRNFKTKEENIRLVSVADAEAAVRSAAFESAIWIPEDFEQRLETKQSLEIKIFSPQEGMINTSTTRISTYLLDFRQAVVENRLAARGLTRQDIEPFTIRTEEVTREDRFQSSYGAWMVIAFVTMYGLGIGASKAMSVSAGEKQNQTMEVLLLAPVNRAAIVLGKTLYVITYGLASLLLSALGYVLTLLATVLALASQVDLEKLNRNVDNLGTARVMQTNSQFIFPGLPSVLIILALVAVVVLIFTALQIVIGLWASSESQGGFLTIGLTMLTGAAGMVFFIPDFSPAPWQYAIPILGQVLLIPDLLINRIELAPLLINLSGSLVFIALLLWLGSWLMNQDNIISRS